MLVEHTFYRKIRVVEGKKELTPTKTGKAIGPDDIQIEAWKCLGENGGIWLTRLFNKILMTKKMSDE